MEFLYTKDPLFYSKPEIITFKDESGDKYCFRTFITSLKDSKVLNKQHAPYIDNECSMISCAELDDGVDIKITKSGNYLITLHVPPYFYPHIIGTRGNRKREIENNTNAHIKMPKQGKNDDIIITGPNERAVLSARMRINMLLLDIRDKHAPTHFVSIPAVSSEIKNGFESFKDKILHGVPIRGVEESIFQKPEKLHLTIVTLVLLDENEIGEATKILHEYIDECWQQLFSNVDDLKIVMQGVEIMNDDPEEVDVLYGMVHLNVPKYNNSLQQFVTGIADRFANGGYVRKQFENVKLHVTLMNSLFRNHSSSDQEKQRETFDATAILEEYKNYLFGECPFNNVHLSVRFTTDNNQYYKSETVVALNKPEA